MRGIYIQLCSAIYLLLITIVFFRKKRTHNLEASSYELLLFATIGVLTLDIITNYLNLNYHDLRIWIGMFGKLYCVFSIIWSFCLVLYVVNINTDNEHENLYALFKNNNYIKIGLVITFLFSVGAIVLNSVFYNDPSNYISYQTGASIYYTYIVCFLYMGFIAIYMIYNPSKITAAKRIPIIVFWVSGLTSIIVQWITRSVLLVSPVMTFSLFFIYFTMENPDIKIINELEKDNEAIEEASKAKTDFLSNMSHDIRTPMNAIIGFSESLLMEKLEDGQKEEVKNIYGAASTLLAIINNILDVSRIESGKEEKKEHKYEFRKIINQLISVVTSKIDNTKIKFNVSIAGDVPIYVIGDELKIYQILMNILSNAAKYTEKGYINFNITSENIGTNARIKFVVEDTGIGIKESDYDKLFVKFSRINNQDNYNTIEGTGLGLVITKELVELLGGTINFISEYGKGTTFTIVIPQIITDSNESSLASELTRTSNAANVHFDGSLYDILVVDDNELNLKVAERILRDYKFHIKLAKSGAEAVDLLKNGERFDLIFLDHMMPVMDGIETLRTMRQEMNNKLPPVIALTANAMVGMKEMYLKEGFNGYISKPINREELQVLLNNFFCKK